MFKHLFNIAHAVLREHLSKTFRRSADWPRARREFLLTHQLCAACLDTAHLQVHHIEPFHLHPELELEPTNFLTLCMGPNECHLKLGHGGSFQSYNPEIRKHAQNFRVAPQATRKKIWEEAKAKRLT